MISTLAMLAKKVIEAAWLNAPAYDLATIAAEALEAEGLLQAPGAGAALDRADAEYERLRVALESAKRGRRELRARVAELEAAPSVPGFFTPGRAYTQDLPYRAPEDRPNFECLGVGMHPTKGSLRALGFEQPGVGRPWKSAAQRMEEWEEGWVDLGPVQPDQLTRIFAPTQVLRDLDGEVDAT
jgi:hypothetical protein